jgi:hypothetical protein
VNNGESSPRDHDHLESNQPSQIASAVLTTAPKDRPRRDVDRAPGPHVDERRDRRNEAAPLAPQPSRMANLLATTAVALIAGALGAFGFLYFYGPEAGEFALSPSKTESGSNKGSSSIGKSDGGSALASAAEPGPSVIVGADSSSEAGELRQQIKNLNHKIDGLGERLDRLQQLLSLAVPLLQRIAPKN